MNQLSFRLKQQKIALRLLAALAIATAMHAGTTGAMPWNLPQDNSDFANWSRCFSISIIGIFATGATLMWGGEMNEFARRAALMGLVAAVIVFATNIMSSAFGITGALI